MAANRWASFANRQDVIIENDLKARIYLPVARSSGLKHPVGVFGHSGGFCEGDLDSEDTLCRIIAHRYPCIVVSIDYRKAPAWKVPTAFEDFLRGFLWAHDSADELGGDQSKVFCFGCSAGGTLSLGTAHKLIELGKGDLLRGVINCAGGAVHPEFVPDRFRAKYNAMTECGSDSVPIINAATARMINEISGLNLHKENPWINPLLSPHLGQFPPTYLVACGVDPLRDDAVLVADELQRLGVRVKIDVYDGLPHIFWMIASLPSAERFVTNLLQGIRFVLERD
ncbi:predicted protein [Aspergillus terreus NIH2624]|uniref:Alpha/beta hydrolase fold-3 domain-containing protein n=1 Tax=Aspergillus terreus (strain NIH 2624 / FGSC A1156) TaxID=341663 RepID=Q0CBQ8_ASPTN|nr:uncharacterized protein ATEG_08876 [Aspergillus terreus NIH2624]EAU31008.1 predicted protein [Aspergillus terreus NIH2624]